MSVDVCCMGIGDAGRFHGNGLDCRKTLIREKIQIQEQALAEILFRIQPSNTH